MEQFLSSCKFNRKIFKLFRYLIGHISYGQRMLVLVFKLLQSFSHHHYRCFHLQQCQVTSPFGQNIQDNLFVTQQTTSLFSLPLSAFEILQLRKDFCLLFRDMFLCVINPCTNWIRGRHPHVSCGCLLMVIASHQCILQLSLVCFETLVPAHIHWLCCKKKLRASGQNDSCV